MREIHPDLIKQHTAVRFRSEYDYALFEYYRSAKVIALLDRAGVTLHGRALDCGCGGGGMPMSLAEHVDASIGIDPSIGSATRASGWRASAACATSSFSRPTGWRCRSGPARSISCCRMR
jgi:cyclopropane fatty-acyl-phospholipid synthase-like methyltransferase